MYKSIKCIVKNLLRYPVDLLLATSKDFPWHVLRALDPQAFRIDPQLVKIKLGPSVSARFRPLFESADTWRIEAPGPGRRGRSR